MMNQKEALYLVDNSVYLHMERNAYRTGFVYEAYDKATGSAMAAGMIKNKDMIDNPIRKAMDCARTMAIKELGLKGEVVAEVALRTLDQVKDAKRSYRKTHSDDTHDHSIRFITSNYDELFRIPDGGRVRVDFPDRHYIAQCEYIDDYHTKIAMDVYHVCQFAEMLERNGGKVSPEPEVNRECAAWKVGQNEYLSIQESEDGWDYSIYDKDFGEIDGGQIDLTSISILECRDMVLEDLGWQERFLKMEDYDLVEERAADVAEIKLHSVIDELHAKRMAMKDKAASAGKTEPQTPRKDIGECL